MSTGAPISFVESVPPVMRQALAMRAGQSVSPRSVPEHESPSATPVTAEVYSDGTRHWTTIDGELSEFIDAEEAIEFAYAHSPAGVEAATIAQAAARSFEDRTGIVIAETTFAKIRERHEQLMRQSHSVAAKLERAGIGGYQTAPGNVIQFDAVKFIANAIRGYRGDLLQGCNAAVQPKFRRCNFIPAIAKEKRSLTLKLIEYWLDRNPHARFWTITSGRRCTASELRARITEMHRLISRLYAEDFVKQAGIRGVFRSTETGSLTDENGAEIRNEAGEFLYHPHAHCIIEMSRYLQPPQWEELKARVRSFLGAHWDEGGQIHNARECAKYPVKPGDLELLSDAETGELFHALRRLHLVQPLGSMKALKDEIISSGDTLELRTTADGPKIVREVNRNRRAKIADEVAPDIEDGLSVSACGDAAGGPMLLATLPPGPYVDRIMRPVVMLRTRRRFTKDDAWAVCQFPHVAALIEKAMPHYLAGVELAKQEAVAEGSAIRVHTSPVTVAASQHAELQFL